MDNKMTTRNPKEEIKYLQDISNLLFDLNQENIELTVQLTMDLFDTNFPISFNLVLIRNIYSSYLSQRKDINIYIQYLQFIEKKEEEILKESPQIFSLFKSYLLSVGIRESNFILVKLVENNLIRPDQFIDHPENKIYFVHLLTKEQISSIENQAQKAQPSFGEQKAIEIIRQQKGSNFEEHKKNMNEGNPSEVTKAIRNDDAEQLQEIISNNKIDIDEPLPVSIYEKFTKCFSCDEHPVTLIQYAAFYGSIKCFKYLLVNGAYIENVGKYAVAGGNIEIIHLCEQNGVTFGNAYKAAIKFHRNDIFYYLYENKLFKCDYNQERTMFIRKCLRYFNFQNPITFSQNQMRNNESEEEKKIKIINYMGSKCIQYDNFDIFLFIENEGINIYDAQFVEEVFASGNLFIVRYLYEGKALPNNAIAYAVSSNNSELVKYVLSRKAINVNIYDNSRKTPLFCACALNNIENVKMLLEQKGIDINAKDINGKTAIMFASYKGNTDIVKLLLEQEGIDVNAKNNDGYTALILASSNGHTKIVKLLLQHKGIDISQQNTRGKTALTFAFENNYIKICKLLLECKGIDINIANDNGLTPLFYACNSGNVDLVKLLLNVEGIDINKCNKYKETPFIFATWKGSVDIVKLLLEQKDIDINAKTKYGETALTFAVRNNYIDIVKLLLEHKEIDVNFVDNREGSPLMYATIAGFVEIVKLLLDHKGIDVNLLNTNGETVLHKMSLYKHNNTFYNPNQNKLERRLMNSHCASKTDQCHFDMKYSQGNDNNKPNLFTRVKVNNKANFEEVKKNQFEIFKLILDKKDVNVNVKSYSGFTPLMTACSEGRTDIVKLLLEHEGIDLDIHGYGGGTAFMLACFNNHLEIVKLLLDHKEIDINHKNNKGMNSLMGAAQNGCFEIVELLLQQKDIKINEVNNNGESAIMLANSNQGGNENCKNIVELLKKQNDIIYDEKLLASETKQAHQVFGGWGAPKPKFAEANPAFLFGARFL